MHKGVLIAEERFIPETFLVCDVLFTGRIGFNDYFYIQKLVLVMWLRLNLSEI